MAKQRLKSPRARLFVALDLPEELREGIIEWQGRELRDPALRPVKPESLHMTLAFLGYRPEKEIEAIAGTAFDLDAPAPTIELAPEPVGVPRGKRPRLFALDARSEGAVALQAQVSDRLEAGRFYEPERRPFWPHLTVARVKPERRGGRKPALVEKVPSPLSERTFAVRRPSYVWSSSARTCGGRVLCTNRWLSWSFRWPQIAETREQRGDLRWQTRSPA